MSPTEAASRAVFFRTPVAVVSRAGGSVRVSPGSFVRGVAQGIASIPPPPEGGVAHGSSVRSLIVFFVVRGGSRGILGRSLLAYRHQPFLRPLTHLSSLRVLVPLAYF